MTRGGEGDTKVEGPDTALPLPDVTVGPGVRVVTQPEDPLPHRSPSQGVTVRVSRGSPVPPSSVSVSSTTWVFHDTGGVGVGCVSRRVLVSKGTLGRGRVWRVFQGTLYRDPPTDTGFMPYPTRETNVHSSSLLGPRDNDWRVGHPHLLPLLYGRGETTGQWTRSTGRRLRVEGGRIFTQVMTGCLLLWIPGKV